MPAASCQILSDRAPRSSSSRGFTPSGSSSASSWRMWPLRALDTHDRCPLDEEDLSLLEIVTIGAEREAVEEAADQVGGIDAHRTRLECGSQMRMTSRPEFAGERLTRCCRLADGHEPRGIRIATAGGLYDQTLGGGESMLLRHIGLITRARPAGEFGCAARLQHLHAALQPGECLGRSNQTGITHDTHVGADIARLPDEGPRPYGRQIRMQRLQRLEGGGRIVHASFSHGASDRQDKHSSCG